MLKKFWKDQRLPQVIAASPFLVLWATLREQLQGAECKDVAVALAELAELERMAGMEELSDKHRQQASAVNQAHGYLANSSPFLASLTVSFGRDLAQSRNSSATAVPSHFSAAGNMAGSTTSGSVTAGNTAASGTGASNGGQKEDLKPPAPEQKSDRAVSNPDSADKDRVRKDKKDKKEKKEEEVDFGPYMAELQKRIKRRWFPPKDQETKRVVVFFKIKRNGQMTDLKIDKSSNVAMADTAALEAVKSAAPFRSLPSGAPAAVDIQFTFDYNVCNYKSADD